MAVDMLYGASLAPLSREWMMENLVDGTRGVVDDLFSGLGGMGAASILAGCHLQYSANHWVKAVVTHGVNFPNTEHGLGDLSILHGRNMPGSGDVLVCSPECRSFSQARNYREALKELGPWDPEREIVRSRATMWCPMRLAVQRGYDAILVENVIEIFKWNRIGDWVAEWEKLGYVVRSICFNGVFFGAPQSRERVAIVITRKGAPLPNLDFRPQAHCWTCEQDVFGVQVYKAKTVRERGDHVLGPWGSYGKQGQYLYHCSSCGTVVSPYITPAINAIDPTIEGEPIFDRKKPLKEGTIERVAEGIKNLGSTAQMVIVDGRGGRKSRPMWLPGFTQTARQEIGFFGGPAAMTTLRQNVTQNDAALGPANAVTAGGNHLGVARPPVTTGPDQKGARCRDAEREPAATITTAQNQMIVGGNRTHNRGRDASQEPAPPMMTGDSVFVGAHRKGCNPRLASAEPGPTCVAGDSVYVGSMPASDLAERLVYPTMLVSPNGNTPSRDAGAEPGFTQVSTTRAAVAQWGDYAVGDPRHFAVTYHRSGYQVRDADKEPIGTQTAKDRHALLVKSGGTLQKDSVQAESEPHVSQLTRDAYGTVAVPYEDVALEDCTFRMIEPKEAQRFMDLHMLPDGSLYKTQEIEDGRVNITRRDAVRLAGNGVIMTAYANVMHRILCARELSLVAVDGRTWYGPDDLARMVAMAQGELSAAA